MVLVRIEMTEQDVLRGRRGQCERCPGTYAISRLVHAEVLIKVGVTDPHFKHADYQFGVGFERIQNGMWRNSWREFPPELHEFVGSYDSVKEGAEYHPPAPAFYIDIPNDCYIGGGE